MRTRRNSLDGIEWVGASRLVSGDPLHTYRLGRICATSVCRTYLSRYNPTSRCSIHK
jgi:hypothetical protein